jgi:hypothetical protein
MYFIHFISCMDLFLSQGRDKALVSLPSLAFNIHFVRMFQVYRFLEDSGVLMHSRDEHMSPSWSQLLHPRFSAVYPTFFHEM